MFTDEKMKCLKLERAEDVEPIRFQELDTKSRFHVHAYFSQHNLNSNQVLISFHSFINEVHFHFLQTYHYSPLFEQFPDNQIMERGQRWKQGSNCSIFCSPLSQLFPQFQSKPGTFQQIFLPENINFQK